MAIHAQTWVRALTLLLIPAIAWGCPGKTPTGTGQGNGDVPVNANPGQGGGSPNFGNPVFPSGRPYGPPPPSPLPPGVSPTPTPMVSPLGDPSATPVANPSPTPTPIAPSPTPPPALDAFLQPPKGVWVDTHYLREGDSRRNEASEVIDLGAPRGIALLKGPVPGLFLAYPGPLGDAPGTGAGVAQIVEETNPDGKVLRSLSVIARSTNVGGGNFLPFWGPRGLAADPLGERMYLIEGPRHVLRLGIFSAEAGSFVFVPHAGASGTPGYADFVGGNARFNDPWGVAVDSGGNAYVTDRGNHCIRKVTLAQVVTTLAGGGVGGFADGNVKSARFQNPQGIAIDPESGYLFVADKGNHAIRRISPEGQVTTIAGGNRAGFKNAQGRDAEFNAPSELVLTKAGLVVWDEGNAVMRLIDAQNNVTTYAGDGAPGKLDASGQLARFQGVGGMTLDAEKQRVYFTEPPLGGINNLSVRVLDPSNFVDTVAGYGRQAPPNPGREGDALALVNDPLGGPALPAQATEGFEDGATGTAKFNEPWGIAVTDDYVAFVVDSGNHAIRRIGVDGVVTTIAGNGSPGFADGSGATARFNTPRGLALDRDGNLIVADQANHRIRRVTPGGAVTTVAGDGTAGFRDGASGQAQFNNPRGVAVDLANQIYVADTANHRVRVIAKDGTVSTYAGEGLPGMKEGAALLARFSSPVGVAVTHQGKVYVADYGNSLIRAILPGDPTILPSPDPNATGPSPTPIANPRTVLSVAGTGQPGWAEGVALTEARFNDPWALATDSKGVTFVADYGNSLIRRIDTVAGKVSLYAGNVPGYPDLVSAFTVPTSGLRDGRAGGAAFAAPAGLALDRRGYLWVSDSKNHRIRIVR